MANVNESNSATIELVLVIESDVLICPPIVRLQFIYKALRMLFTFFLLAHGSLGNYTHLFILALLSPRSKISWQVTCYMQQKMQLHCDCCLPEELIPQCSRYKNGTTRPVKLSLTLFSFLTTQLSAWFRNHCIVVYITYFSLCMHSCLI